MRFPSIIRKVDDFIKYSLAKGNMESYKVIRFWIIYALIALAFTALFFFWNKAIQDFARPFQGNLAQYEEICRTALRSPVDETKPLKGRVLLLYGLNKGDLRVMWGADRLPEDLVARTPDEVGTIVFGQYQGATLIGRYTGGGEAWAGGDLTLYVVDAASRRIIGSDTISGVQPPRETTVGSVHGRPASWPEKGFLTKFLRDLRDRK
jgi:hypothetical protein